MPSSGDTHVMGCIRKGGGYHLVVLRLGGAYVRCCFSQVMLSLDDVFVR